MSRSSESPADRVVEAAIAGVRERGISVGLEGISLEEAIVSSGVSRATAYRYWPNRTEFLREVLVRIVRSARLEPEGAEELDAIRAFLQANRRRLATEAGRRTVVVESLRIAAEADFGRLAASRQWRDYLALRATCNTLPESDLRDTVTAELAAAERDFARHRAAVYARLPQLLGYRIVPALAGVDGFTVLAEAMGALMTGLVVRSSVAQDSASFRAKAFGSTQNSRWSITSYALVANLLSYLEPDPTVDWDADRIAASITAFDEIVKTIKAGSEAAQTSET